MGKHDQMPFFINENEEISEESIEETVEIYPKDLFIIYFSRYIRESEQIPAYQAE